MECGAGPQGPGSCVPVEWGSRGAEARLHTGPKCGAPGSLWSLISLVIMVIPIIMQAHLYLMSVCVSVQVTGWLGSAGHPIGGGFWQEQGCYTNGGMGWGAEQISLEVEEANL